MLKKVPEGSHFSFRHCRIRSSLFICLGSRHVLYPFPAVQPDGNRYNLVDLIPFQQKEHHHRRTVKHKGSQRGKRYNDQPHAEQVHLHTEGSIPSAPDDAIVTGQLEGSADCSYRHDRDKL